MVQTEITESKKGETETEKYLLLLEMTKVIRDPVHGDIEITDLEREIIDHPWFQRLRRIRQLGLTHFVYPGANHTRFEHSIGTLYLAQKIIDGVNRNFETDFKYNRSSREGLQKLSQYAITPQDRFKTRIVALLHDSAHASFGHTIEQEGNILGQNHQMVDPRRKSIVKQIFSPIIEKYMINTSFDGIDADEIINEIFDILIAEEGGKEEDLMILNRPFIADIVGNTICADLLDYLKRDTYFTGLKMDYDPRIFSYFVLRDYKFINNKKEEITKPRLALTIEKRKGDIRRDILSYCVDLLYHRYSLAEKVYSHRVKTKFSALVIKCLYCAIKSGYINLSDNGETERLKSEWEKLMLWGDDALLRSIAGLSESTNEYLLEAKTIAESILNREPFIETYCCEIQGDPKRSLVERYRNPDERYNEERHIENIFELPRGSVIIYAPGRDKGKPAQVKVFGLTLLNPPVRQLDDLGEGLEGEYSTIGNQIREINKRYSLLWKFYVFVRKSETSIDNIDQIEKVCKSIFEKQELESLELVIRSRAKILQKKNEIQGTFPIENVIDKLRLEVRSDPRNYAQYSQLDFIDQKIKEEMSK